MYVTPKACGRGNFITNFKELENWVVESQYKSSILETVKRQGEAINLYKKNNYVITLNYGQYLDVVNSICFKKEVPFKNKLKHEKYKLFITDAHQCIFCSISARITRILST